jgi:hypothetical protein
MVNVTSPAATSVGSIEIEKSFSVAATAVPPPALVVVPAALEELESLLHATDTIASTATSAKNARRV